jgi:hypothetical protein
MFTFAEGIENRPVRRSKYSKSELIERGRRLTELCKSIKGIKEHSQVT